MDGLGHPPCSFLPESSWESFDARTSGSSCPCHGTTGRIASQAGTGHDDPQRLAVRAQIVLLAAAGHSSEQIVGKLVVTRPMVRKWRRRWSASQDQLRVVEGEESDSAVQSRICEILADAPRCGRPSDISPEQILEIIALRRSRGRAATVQPLDTRRGGPRVCAPRDYREHLHPICGSFFKRRPILDRTACATGCNWTKLTRRRSTQPPSRSATSTGVRRSFTNAAFMSCAATRRRESRLWSEPLRHDLLSLNLSNSKMLTTSATARARSLPTSKLPLVRSSLQASVPLEMSTTSPTTSAALSL